MALTIVENSDLNKRENHPVYLCCLAALVMQQLVQHRELGLSSPRQLVRCETARHILSLQLSSYQDVEPIHSATVNSLDIDAVERR